MSDYRNLKSDYRHPVQPDLHRDGDAHGPYAVWGWIAGATLLVLAMAGAFDISFEPIQPPCRSLCAMNGPK